MYLRAVALQGDVHILRILHWHLIKNTNFAGSEAATDVVSDVIEAVTSTSTRETP